MTAHTPGPWTIAKRPMGFQVVGPRGYVVADVYGSIRSPEEHAADAALIASAPTMAARIAELEAALRYCADYIECNIADGIGSKDAATYAAQKARRALDGAE